MNKAKVRRLATAILNAELATRKRGGKIGYNQSTFYSKGWDRDGDKTGHHCSTNACIAGWQVALDGGNIKKLTGDKIWNNARVSLGLTDKQAGNLFQGVGGTITQKDAALVLFNLAETGKVDWEVTGYSINL